MLGDHRQRRQQGQRLERRDRGGALERLDRHIQHREMIGHEEGIEPPALQRLGEAHHVLKVEVGIGIGPGVTPRGGMNGSRAHEGAQAELAFLGHGAILLCKRRLAEPGLSGETTPSVGERCRATNRREPRKIG